MAQIMNDRDVFLQGASPRFVLPQISTGQIPGYDDLLDDVNDLMQNVNHLMNTSKSFVIRAPATTFIGSSGTTNPSTITLTAVKSSGVTGTVTWSVFAGVATLTPNGDDCVVTGSSVTGASVTVRARITNGGVNQDAFITLSRLGKIAASDYVDLSNQVTGSLSSGNVSGLGALALLNTVNLNTQTTGTLNGQTQVTNLGSLAYANTLAANQIGAGTLAAGVIYAGSINADNITSGTITGRTVRTAASGYRVELSNSNLINFYGVHSGTIGPGSSSQAAILVTTSSNTTTMAIFGNGGADALRIASDGYCLDLRNNGSRAAMFMGNRSSLPTYGSIGDVCMYGGWLCTYRNGAWYRSDGTLA